ncbi:lipooligosaccharide transport system ATP-binding protein [Austwickia chelonae]|uniref:Putative ABC transporter ATP-binding protein n=1 Tax=Austwickia chelonae NBRC 105200 TaxID=1184607 RepID=K6VRH5_9MICO|nr:ABC transporter ATP-binding protein [Austwickia chelonae]GAB79369.1 putative ABC transporter ATP-binding protein [Austwickia chelonae NBRC 105200]SEW43816.1 lipooligosaccharide transport system ATP-binding protein [Austwickia chelonae]
MSDGSTEEPPEPGDAPTHSDHELVRARALRKNYGTFEAVKAVDITVRRGELFGFLGPNGAGKSTTMRMIATVSPRTGGDLSVLGLDPATDGSRIRARLGVCPQEDTLDKELSVRENLTVFGRYFGLSRSYLRERADELLDFANLTEKAQHMVDELSGGMKRRLTIARSLVNTPDLLLLDEPTTGLDPQARHLLWDQLYRLKHSGVTQILTTHYMDEAEQLCDRLVVMDDGRIVAEGSPAELIRAHSTREVVEARFGVITPQEMATVAARLDGLVDRAEFLPDRVLLYTDDADHTLSAVHSRVRAETTLARRSTLEDVFLHLTGRALVD